MCSICYSGIGAGSSGGEGDLFNSIFGSGVATSGYQWLPVATARGQQGLTNSTRISKIVQISVKIIVKKFFEIRALTAPACVMSSSY